MLNQVAVEIHTFLVDQSHSHLIQFLKWMLRDSFSGAEPQRLWAAKHMGHTWYIGKRFLQISDASSSAP